MIVGILWNDWSLIVVNIVGSTIMLIGILHYHFFTDWYLNIYEVYIIIMTEESIYKKYNLTIDAKKHLSMH